MQTLDSLVGNQEDWANYITNVEMLETPYLDWLPVGSKPVNAKFQYQAEAYRAPRRNSHVDGAPFGEPYSTGDSRKEITSYVQWFDHGISASKLTQDVSNPAGINDVIGREVPKAFKEMARDMEVNFQDDNDARVGTANLGYLTRGVGCWLGITSQSVGAVPSAFATPAASRSTTAWASMTEDTLRGVLQSIYETKKDNEMLTAFAGPTAMRGLSDFQYRLPSSAASAPTVNPAVQRTYKDQNISRRVVTYDGDFMNVEFVPSVYLSYLTSGTGTTASRGRVHFQHRSMWEIRWNQKPAAYKQPFNGGSYEVFMDAIAMQVCKNPLGEGALAPS